MRLIFLGSGEFGLPTLRDLHAKHQVLAVVTQPDRPAGRHRQLTPTPIAAWAAEAGLSVHKAENVNEPAFVEQVRALGAEASVVIAFGQKLGEPLIAALGKLAVNLHASLLPKYRGAAPINWAMIEGEIETGVSVIGLAQRMDAGLVYVTAATPIDPLETAGELHDRLALLGPGAVGRVLEQLQTGTLAGVPQDEARATKAPKLSRADGVIDFDQDGARLAWRIHGLTPWPGVRVGWRKPDGTVKELMLRRVKAEPDLSCFFGHRGGPKPGAVLEGGRVAVRDGELRLVEVQMPGGKPMKLDEFLRGHRLEPGDRLEPLREG